ncbi:uncharacterized protein LOC119726117 isoform X2 [Patiria miniata]|uniref:BHLH domain-containing protein n=1 Tax=Patiria miniata TaxID=46514 RepID=A0A913ZR89_PATMI|nr:uncharacterized protein LOC119726117 isoform X2 [Patiria miniata]
MEFQHRVTAEHHVSGHTWSKVNSDEILTASPSSTNSSPALTPRKWSHKKFGHRKRPAVPELPTLRPRRHTATQSTPSLTETAEPGSATGPSPRKEEKKKKRRASDAKWRSNLSVCFKHLETKVLRARSCSKTRLSKEMIVQKTVQKVQYLESIFMLLNQADKKGKKCEFSPVRGLQSLQSARREFANRSYYRNIQKAQGRSSTNTAVENPDPKPSLQEGVVPENSRTNSEQLVPPSVTITAGQVMKEKSRGNKSSSHASRTATKQKAQQDRAVPSTPTKSLICEEQDLDPEDPSPKTPKFNTKDPTKGGFSGHISQFQVMTSPRRKAPSNTAQIPSQSPVRSGRKGIPTTPSLYSPDKPQAWSPLNYKKADVGQVGSKSSRSASPARKNGGADPHRSPNNLVVTSPAKSPAAKYDRVAPHWPAYWSPAKSPAESPVASSGLASPCRVPCWSPPRTPNASPATRRGSVALSYRPSNWSPAGKVASKNAFGYQPQYSPGHSPVVHQVMADFIRPLASCPTRASAYALATSPGRSYGSIDLVSSSDLVMTSPSKRYKIVGKSIMSLGDAEPGTWEIPPFPSSDVAGRSTPDLTCQEEILSWREENKSKNLTPYTTPSSNRFPLSSTSQPPSVPPKKRPATWSAKFVNDVRQSQSSLVTTQTKSKRCKRLFYDEIGERAAGESNSKKQKFQEASISMDGSDIKKKGPRRKYHKRATAARIRPWDPVNSKVSSPVCGITRQQNNLSKSKSSPSSTASSAEPSPQQRPKTKLCGQNKPSRRKSRKPRKIVRGGLRIVIKEEHKADLELGVEEIIDVDEVDPDCLTKEFRKTSNNRQLFSEKSNYVHVDQDSSQGSLLLSEIPQLPDEIIAPLLLSGDSEQCFLEDSELERTLQPEMYATSANANRLKTTKSDDEIVLTILDLEEESRTSASTRSSPDSVSTQHSDPTAATDFVSVLDQEGFSDQLQGALLEAYRLMSAEAGTSGCPPTVILSPVRLSKLGSLNRELSPQKTFYLVSPVKQEKQNLGTDAKERGYLGEHGEDNITESMARFASSALSGQSLDSYNQQPKTNHDVSEAIYSDNEKVYRGATQALLNGQLVSKTASSLKASSYQAQTTLICVDSGTPTKNQSKLPYSVPATATTGLEFVIKKPETSNSASDTNINVGSPYVSTSPSTSTLSTPRGYMNLSHLSQSSAEHSLSPELPKEAYSLPIIKQEQWDWTDPPTIDLQADESLDDLMSEDLLARYCHTYDCLGVDLAAQNSVGEGLIEVPDWQPEKNVGSQSSNGDFSSSMSSSSSLSSSLSPLVTGRISHGSATSDSMQSAECQVVPNLSADDNGTVGSESDTREGELTGNQFGFQRQEVKSEIEDSPGKSLQMFHCWLVNQ